MISVKTDQEVKLVSIALVCILSSGHKPYFLQILSEEQNKKPGVWLLKSFGEVIALYKGCWSLQSLETAVQAIISICKKQDGNKLARIVNVIQCYSLTWVTFNLCPCTKDVTGSCQLCAMIMSKL